HTPILPSYVWLSNLMLKKAQQAILFLGRSSVSEQVRHAGASHQKGNPGIHFQHRLNLPLPIMIELFPQLLLNIAFVFWVQSRHFSLSFSMEIDNLAVAYSRYLHQIVGWDVD